jgi:hypothetical protein
MFKKLCADEREHLVIVMLVTSDRPTAATAPQEQPAPKEPFEENRFN